MKSEMICSACGSVGAPIARMRGSFWIEIVLWLCFLVPGLLYTIWRTTTKETVCAACGKSSLVPLDTPIGQKLQRELAAAKPAGPVLRMAEKRKMGREIW